MKGKKVFLVIDEWCLAGGAENSSIYNIYENYEDALKYFENDVEKAKIDGDEWGLNEEAKNKDFYEIWLNGEYSGNHITVSIKEMEVK